MDEDVTTLSPHSHQPKIIFHGSGKYRGLCMSEEKQRVSHVIHFRAVKNL